jgi:lysine-N-methylase
MQLDSATRNKYEKDAPELLDAVDTGEAEWIMKRDAKTDYCVRFDNGLCGIHKSYGTDFLGDACHFYPRITRSLGETQVMTAALSCPEAARLMLFSNSAFDWDQTAADRLPNTLRDYRPAALSDADSLAIHQGFIRTVAEAPSPERAVMRINSVARSLEALPQTSWLEALSFYMRSADGRLPKPELVAADPFNLVYMLHGLLRAAKPSSRTRLMLTLQEMQQALAMTQDPDSGQPDTTEESLLEWQMMEQAWHVRWRDAMQPILTRWLQSQLSMMLFPFAGLGERLSERATLLGVRFALTRLSLMSLCHLRGGEPMEADVIRAVQSLSRFVDHLADPTLSLRVCSETGWDKEARLRSLIGDTTDKLPISNDLSTVKVS